MAPEALMDQVSQLAFEAAARRALLFEQWLVQHTECWPGPSVSATQDEPLAKQGKCTCGASIVVTITLALVVDTPEVDKNFVYGKS